MPAKKVQVNILGKGHCEVNAIEKLHVEIKGQANVYAKGMPSLYKRITGQGDVYFTISTFDDLFHCGKGGPNNKMIPRGIKLDFSLV